MADSQDSNLYAGVANAAHLPPWVSAFLALRYGSDQAFNPRSEKHEKNMKNIGELP
jgi:hypothetical protein